MHERLERLERGRFAGADLLGMATRNGYRALGWDDGGVIATGRLADLVAVRLDSPRTAGAPPDRVLYAATSADVSDVVVAGDHVVRDGRHRAGDVGRLLTDAITAVRR
jgi:cytosine/adenosine deaminase-related metal-dependent hydrolase